MEKKTNLPRIGIDLMGSDTHPEVIYLAALELAESLQAELYLFADASVFSANHPSNVQTIPTKDVITMEDSPLNALRTKKEASLCIGTRYLHENKIDAFISFGNTGALMASAKMTLGMLPSIDRPALLTLFPAKKGDIAVLDVGANTTYKPEHLLQFAQMGIAFKKCLGIPNPKVGLLNIGSEALKGSPLVREAYQQLETLGPTFIGNIEARHAMASTIDILIADGFSGNIFLKTAEGIASFILDQLQDPAYHHQNLPTTTSAALTHLKHYLDYSAYPGALLCGVQGIVFKCHGAFSAKALAATTSAAFHLTSNNFFSHLLSLLP